MEVKLEIEKESEEQKEEIQRKEITKPHQKKTGATVGAGKGMGNLF